MGTLLVLVVINLFSEAKSIDIPSTALTLPKAGIITEPETIVLNYDRVLYRTIGVNFGIVPEIKDLDPKTTCHITHEKKKVVLDTVKSVIRDYFKTLPKHFSPLSNHHCHGTSIDCFLNEVDDISINSQRGKRQVFLAIAAVAGIASAGVGMYNIFSDKTLSNHIGEVDRNVASIETYLNQSAATQHQYNTVSRDVSLKLYQGMSNMKETFFRALCSHTGADWLSELTITMNLFIEEFKRGIQTSMDGEVGEFLITYDYLQKEVLSAGDYDGTVYKVDPGLFYSTSSSLLYKVDTDKQIVYFLVSTPVILEQDISPLYAVENFGWIEKTHHLSYDVPKHFFYLTDQDQVVIGTPDLTRCRMSRGLYICSLQSTTRDESSMCIENLIHHNSTKSCRTKVTKDIDPCKFKTLRSGFASLGCGVVEKISKVRTISSKEVVPIPSNGFLFLPYSDFQTIHITGYIISTRQYHLRTVIRNSPEFDASFLNSLDDDIFDIPGIEHRLDQLKALSEKYGDKSLPKMFQSKRNSNRLVMGLTSTIILIFIIVICRWAWLKIRSRKPRKSRKYAKRLDKMRSEDLEIDLGDSN